MMRVSIGLVALVLSSATEARAQNIVINAPGLYTLGADSTSTSYYNIAITGGSVTLDLNGKTVRCAPPSPATGLTFGVYVGAVSTVTIRNGKITGCFMGVHASNATYVTLEDIDFTGNTYIGANMAGGSNRVVRRCKFADIAGYSSEAYAIGLNGIGHNGVIEDNQFINLYKQPNTNKIGEGIGVLIEAGAQNVTVRRNTFTNGTPTANTIGVWFGPNAAGFVTSNTFTNWASGVEGSGPITATDNTIKLTATFAGSKAFSVKNGTASGNTIIGYATAVSGGMVDGGNTIQPIGEPPPSPPPVNGRWFRFCVDDANTCYEGVLPPKPPGV